MTPEDAMDWFRAEGGWEPLITDSAIKANLPKSAAVVPTTGKFTNQCGRCLDWAPSARVDLPGWVKTRVWLCDSCSGPNPKVVVPAKLQTFWEWLREGREALKAVEKERKRLERESKQREKAVSRQSRKDEARLAKVVSRKQAQPGPQGTSQGRVGGLPQKEGLRDDGAGV